jgi:hypothetical protein
MMYNFFLFVCFTYVIAMAGLLWQTFVPPKCRASDQCILPLFDQADLASADLYFFVTDDPALGLYRAHGDRPPAHIARAAWAVLEAGDALQRAEAARDEKARACAADGEANDEADGEANCEASGEASGEANGEVQCRTTVAATIGTDDDAESAVVAVPSPSLKLAWRARGLDLGGASVASSWEQKLRVPVFASSRNNATLYGLFFLCPGGRPLDPASYPLVVPAVVKGALLGGGRQRTFEESVLFTSVELTVHLPRRTASGASMLLERTSGAVATSDATLPLPPQPPQGAGDAHVVSHWRFSSHPLRLRVVAVASLPLPHAHLQPDGLALLLHRANPHFFGTRNGGGSEAATWPPRAPGPLVYRP